jgi:pSer/pThr/pTyr-binding forkhead associated (FHA) protein
MPLRLRVIPRAEQKAGDSEPASTERIVEFADDVDEIRIGRRSDLELSLPFKALSGLHARIRRQASGSGERSHTWVIEDLESKNGTFVGKSRIKPGEHRLLFAGDKVDLGPVKVMFDGHSQATPSAEGTATIARRLVSDLLMASPGASAPTLSVISGASKEIETLKLLDRDRPYFIGRDPGCDLSFPHEELSRQHASFTRTWNGVVLRDQGSKNGIIVNGIVVTVQRLSDGDEIEMGPLKLRLMDPEDKYLRELEGPDRAERAPRGETGPKPVVVMPAALAVSLPPMPTPTPPAAEPASGAAPRKLSRLAPRPAGGPPENTGNSARAPRLEPRTTLDEQHPAIAARRPPADAQPQQGYEQTEVRRARKTMWFAAALLFAIVAAVVYLTLGAGSE